MDSEGGGGDLLARAWQKRGAGTLHRGRWGIKVTRSALHRGMSVGWSPETHQSGKLIYRSGDRQPPGGFRRLGVDKICSWADQTFVLQCGQWTRGASPEVVRSLTS